jgi:hypothetical protein
MGLSAGSGGRSNRSTSLDALSSRKGFPSYRVGAELMPLGSDQRRQRSPPTAAFVTVRGRRFGYREDGREESSWPEHYREIKRVDSIPRLPSGKRRTVAGLPASEA